MSLEAAAGILQKNFYTKYLMANSISGLQLWAHLHLELLKKKVLNYDL